MCIATQSCPTLHNHTDCSLPDSSVHGILQARILEWVAVPSCRGSSQPRDWTWVSCIAGRFFTIWATREAPDISTGGWSKLLIFSQNTQPIAFLSLHGNFILPDTHSKSVEVILDSSLHITCVKPPGNLVPPWEMNLESNHSSSPLLLPYHYLSTGLVQYPSNQSSCFHPCLPPHPSILRTAIRK